MVNIIQQRYFLGSVPIDGKTANFYYDGLNIVIETIAEYLSRVQGFDRVPGGIVSVLYPKDGFSCGNFDAETLSTIFVNFEGRYYSFVGGLDDVHFIRIFLTETEMSIEGDGTLEDKIRLVNDEESPESENYYGTDINGIKGYHALPEIPNHDELSGLNTGDYQHLTQLEKPQIFHSNREALDLVIGTNTGDETKVTIQNKLEPSSGSNDGYLKISDFLLFASKQPMIQFGSRTTGSNPGYVGEIWVDDDYLYICVIPGEPGTAKWKKITLLTN